MKDRQILFYHIINIVNVISNLALTIIVLLLLVRIIFDLLFNYMW